MDPQAAIPWRSRPDLQKKVSTRNGLGTCDVKDPVTLAYFELRDEEAFVLNQLDQPVSILELCKRFNEKFRPHTLAPDELTRFVGQLVQQGLLVAQQPGYGRLLVSRTSWQDSSRRWLGLTNLLALRFRGFDPDRLLGWLVNRCGWLFSFWTMILASLLIGSAILLVTVQYQQLLARLPEARAWLNAENVLLMACLLGCVKILHEFGHGLACKKLGGECHEMGFMLLVFTPCLYCNVTDVWMLNNKWHRAAVSAAGIAVEATIAAGCTFLWWLSEPGLFHSICLNLMIVCGVSTLLFNGNPLLRYDGYFILSDLLEIPNLYQQASETVRRRLGNWYLGLKSSPPRNTSRPREMGLFLYGISSSVYRGFLTVSIIWFLQTWLKPHGLAPFVQVFGVLMLGMMFVVPPLQLFRWVRQPAQRARIRWGPFALKAGVTALGLAWLLLTPFPAGIETVASYDMHEVARVYVTAEGTLVDSVAIGAEVTSGQEVARLVEPRLERELARLQGETEEHRVRLEQLERRRVHEPALAAQIPIVREAFHDLKQQYERRQHDAERLVLRAPRAGVVVSASVEPRIQSAALPFWSGSPLDDKNRGCFLRAGTTVCLIGDQTDLQAMLLINQDDFPLVRVGQKVRMQSVTSPGEILEGQITELAALDLEHVPTSLIRRANLPTRLTSAGLIKPVGTWYQARVQLPKGTNSPLPGTASPARIQIEPQSLLSRFQRWFNRTFATSQN